MRGGCPNVYPPMVNPLGLISGVLPVHKISIKKSINQGVCVGVGLLGVVLDEWVGLTCVILAAYDLPSVGSLLVCIR